MANEYYNPSNAPATSSNLSSATMRAEFAAIGSAMDKMPVLAGKGDEVVTITPDSSGLASKTSGAVVGVATTLAASKATPADADLLPLVDSAASYILKKLTWANLKTALLSAVGNLTFTGTGNRITGDFSNATVANRVMFQTSTVNGASVVGVIPNGASTTAQLAVYGGADPSNAQVLRVDTRGGAESRIESTYSGTPAFGTYLPMTFYTGGSERMRITAGNGVSIGHDSPSAPLDVAGIAWFRGAPTAGALLAIVPDNTSGANGVALAASFASGGYGPMRFVTSNAEAMRIDASGYLGVGQAPYSTGHVFARQLNGLHYFDISNVSNTAPSDGAILRLITANVAGSGTASADISKSKFGTFYINNNEPNAQASITVALQSVNRLVMDSAGNTQHVSATGGLGYGTGAGGTVTQATSKYTAVTLNKPTGQITMNAAALAAGASATFQFNNTLIAAPDLIVCNPGNFGNYTAQTYFCTTGACGIRVTNISGGPLSEAVTINFCVLKGAIS